MSQRPSLRARIRHYFSENPDEYLKMEDVAAKFGCTRQQAYWAVTALRAEGDLETLFVVTKARQEEPA